MPAAASLLEETVKLEPRNVMAWYLLGQCREQRNPSPRMRSRRGGGQLPSIQTSARHFFALAHALRLTDRAESEEVHGALYRRTKRPDASWTARLRSPITVWWLRRLTTGLEATRQLKDALAECGDCAMKADLHKKLGLVDCQAGNLDDGEKELLVINKLKPTDPEIQRALDLIARHRKQSSGSVAGEGAQ